MAEVVLSDKPPYLSSVSRLVPAAKTIVLALLEHPVVQRLKNIKQLGNVFAVFPEATHTRWEHTLHTLDYVCRIVELAPTLPMEFTIHLLASSILQDIGHSPLSESLGKSFADDWNTGFEFLPHDKARTLAILRHLEEADHFLSGIGLSPELVFQMILGVSSRSGEKGPHQLIEGELDPDRLAYIPQDSASTLGVDSVVPSQKLAASLIFDGPENITIISPEGLDSAVELIRLRGTLYTTVYFDNEKVAIDHLMRVIVKRTWDLSRAPDIPILNKPRTVPDFLGWTDATVARLLSNALGDPLLMELDHLWGIGQIYVAEVIDLGNEESPFENINRRLKMEPQLRTFPDRLCWIISSSEIGDVTIYKPNSILVKNRGRYNPIETSTAGIKNLHKFHHRPLVVLSAAILPEYVSELTQRGLTLSTVKPIRRPFTVGASK